MKKLLTTLLLALACAGGAQAQAWPTKPVTLLVPFPPGGSTDLIARTLAPKLQEKLGGNFIVENKAGAGGSVGTAAVKRAAPDGYNILVTSLGPLVIGPHLLKNVPYDALKDLDYITVAVQAPNVLCVHFYRYTLCPVTPFPLSLADSSQSNNYVSFVDYFSSVLSHFTPRGYSPISGIFVLPLTSRILS